MPQASAILRMHGVQQNFSQLPQRRYLVEAPPNICTPTHIARAAQAIADSASDVMTCQILEKADCEAMGMGCFLGVAECSEEPLKFVHLTYKPKGDHLLHV